jgi:hypothetical protein
MGDSIYWFRAVTCGWETCFPPRRETRLSWPASCMPVLLHSASETVPSYPTSASPVPWLRYRLPLTPVSVQLPVSTLTPHAGEQHSPETCKHSVTGLKPWFQFRVKTCNTRCSEVFLVILDFDYTAHTGCFEKSFATLRAPINVFGGHVQCF